MIGEYNGSLVVLSAAIAIVASYAALDLTGRTRAAAGARPTGEIERRVEATMAIAAESTTRLPLYSPIMRYTF